MGRGTSGVDHPRRFGQTPITSALPRLADVFRAGRHVSKVPKAEVTVLDDKVCAAKKSRWKFKADDGLLARLS
jgi:hypothetical protein